MYCTVIQEIGVPTLMVMEKCFSRNCRQASRSALLYSYGTHQPIGPNFLRSWTTLCKNDCTYTRVLHLGWSILSSNSWLTIVVYVRERPAFRPAGGSNVTLIAICNRPIGKRSVISHVIQRRKSSSISGVLVSTSSNSFMYPMPRWQFCRITHPPVRKAALF